MARKQKKHQWCFLYFILSKLCFHFNQDLSKDLRSLTSGVLAMFTNVEVILTSEDLPNIIQLIDPFLGF